MRKELLNEIRQQTREDFTRLWQEWRVPRKRVPSEWASEVRRIAPGTSPMAKGEAIPYTHELFPHCVEIMDAPLEEGIHRVVIWAAIRDGKTLSVCANLIGWIVEDSPRNIYSVHPTEDNAATFSTGDVEPMIDLCLDGLFVEKKSRDTGRTIEFKKFHGGWLRIFSANSLAKFHGTSVGALFLHELDKLPREAIEKAFGRTTGYDDAVIVLESTCTHTPQVHPETGELTYRSNIHRAYDEGDKRKWFCPCRRCGHLQWLKYPQIKWPRGRMDLAAYHCEACDFAHNERDWRRMVRLGEWFPTAGLTVEQERDIAKNWKHAKAKDPACRSYWRNGFNNLLPKSRGYKTKLQQFAVEGESAKKDRTALERWTNEVAAELWNPDYEKTAPPAYQPILDGREDYAPPDGVGPIIVPPAGLVITAMTDLHGDRLEIEWRAWSRTEESWGLGHHVIFGDPNRQSVWEEWCSHMQKKWKHASGGELSLGWGLIDGGWNADPLIALLERLRTRNVPGVSGLIRISKGMPNWQSVIVSRWASITKRLHGVQIGTWAAKSLLYQRLAWHSSTVKPSEGFVHFGKNYSDEFIRQIVSESPVWANKNGVDVETFKNPDGNRNEGLDLLVGNLAAFRFRKWDFEMIERQLKEQGEPQGEPEPAPARREAFPISLPSASPFGRGWQL